MEHTTKSQSLLKWIKALSGDNFLVRRGAMFLVLVVGTVIPELITQFSLDKTENWQGITNLFIVSAVVIIFAFLLIGIFMFFLTKEPKKTTKIRDQLTQSIFKALDKSSINPAYKVRKLNE